LDNGRKLTAKFIYDENNTLSKVKTMSSPKVNDRDKPFILALVSAGITLTNIVIAAAAGWVGNWTLMNQAIDTMKYTFTITGVAWTFYFGKPSQQTQQKPT
jgi:hypothetical protein